MEHLELTIALVVILVETGLFTEEIEWLGPIPSCGALSPVTNA
jgi:hypothetical protein